MSKLFLSIGAPSGNWVRHSLPWLTLLAMVMGLARDEDIAGSETLRD